jgi:hypothetical protein
MPFNASFRFQAMAESNGESRLKPTTMSTAKIDIAIVPATVAMTASRRIGRRTTTPHKVYPSRWRKEGRREEG